MILLEISIENSLLKIYNETNDIAKACTYIKELFKDISVDITEYDDYYKIIVYLSIHNTYITSVNLQKNN